MKPIFTLGATAALVLLLTGCAAMQTAIEKRHLDVHSKMSDSVFLTPVPEKEHTVYVQYRNTSDKENFNLVPLLDKKIAAKGYTVVSNPDHAHYLLQINVLSVGKTDPSAAQTALLSGFGGALTGGLATAALTSNLGMIAGGTVVGGLVDTVTDSLVTDVTYGVITDVQISRHSDKKIKASTEQVLAQGSSSHTRQAYTTDSHWLKYRTRVVSTAERVNLSFASARPALENSLSTSIAGIL